MLLPDLKPWVSEDLGFAYDWTIQGNDLRLTTAMANVGAGVLELRGGETHGDTQDVHQRIYNSDGSFTDVLAGEFIYHPEHAHVHFDDFADFRLREVLPNGGIGDVVAATEKVSFCLLDVERYDGSGPASPHYLSCEHVQGISAGWSDVYDRGLPGQSIEITNVADGNYWLELVVDPHNRLIESDETNNIERIQISLERPVGENPIAPDTFESNDSFARASILAPPEDHTYENLSIHASLNDDYFRITASETGTLSFDLAFQHAQGDVDMEIYNVSGTLLGRSESATDNENFSLSANAGDFYFVKVYGYEGATNPDYTFIVDQPAGGGAPADDILIGEEIRPNGFDAAYYLATNPDVALAGVDAWEHYSLNGWKEGFGRNPNAYFDSDGYLETYSDVKDAGVNPLEHYHQYGWAEGRDPSKTFDTDGYLEANPDVDAAQVDPLQHYLQHGHAEGRTVYDDGVWG